MSVEFVDQAKAEAEAARAIGLIEQAGTASIEACFALQAVADQVGPSSNLGVQGVSWTDKGTGSGLKNLCMYQLRGSCVDGPVWDSVVAPPTLDEARSPEHLTKPIAILERKIAEKGGLTARASTQRPQGTSAALLAAVAASERGRVWIEHRKKAHTQLLRMVKIADAYGRDGVCEYADISAHAIFLTFDNRADLIRAYPTTQEAKGKALSLRGKADEQPPSSVPVKTSVVKALATHSGVTRREARVLLQAALDGRSERKLMRAVREAVRIAAESEQVAA